MSLPIASLGKQLTKLCISVMHVLRASPLHIVYAVAT